MHSFLLIYFLTCLLPDLSIYYFQNRPVLFSGWRSEATKPGFSFLGVHLCCVIFCYGCMFAFVIFDLVFVLNQEIGWEERLQNELICVEWDVKR